MNNTIPVTGGPVSQFNVMDRTILVTGGAGFIGSNFILQQILDQSTCVVNLDKLTYAGNLGNLVHLTMKRGKFIYKEGVVAPQGL